MPSIPSVRPCLLLIENDPMVRETITLLLQEHYVIVPVPSGESVLARLAAEARPAIDKVVLDYELPPTTVTAVLGQVDQRKIPVLLLSGNPTRIRSVDAKRPLLAKPFTQAALLAALDGAL